MLPGFGNNDTPSPALPLALYDLGGGPTISRGRAAPLALRMFVESVLSVPMHERERGQPVAMSVSLREFLQWLYPTRTPTPAEYWPKLMRAIEALDSWDARIPLYDPQTRRSELRRVVSVRRHTTRARSAGRISPDHRRPSSRVRQRSPGFRPPQDMGHHIRSGLPAFDQHGLPVAPTRGHDRSRPQR